MNVGLVWPAAVWLVAHFEQHERVLVSERPHDNVQRRAVEHLEVSRVEVRQAGAMVLQPLLLVPGELRHLLDDYSLHLI